MSWKIGYQPGVIFIVLLCVLKAQLAILYCPFRTHEPVYLKSPDAANALSGAYA